jgi:hypothetical protein
MQSSHQLRYTYVYIQPKRGRVVHVVVNGIHVKDLTHVSNPRLQGNI